MVSACLVDPYLLTRFLHTVATLPAEEAGLPTGLSSADLERREAVLQTSRDHPSPSATVAGAGSPPHLGAGCQAPKVPSVLSRHMDRQEKDRTGLLLVHPQHPAAGLCGSLDQRCQNTESRHEEGSTGAAVPASGGQWLDRSTGGTALHLV